MTHLRPAIAACLAAMLLMACGSTPAGQTRPSRTVSPSATVSPGDAVWTLRSEMTLDDFQQILLSQQLSQSAHVTANGVLAGHPVAVTGDTDPRPDSLAIRGTTADGLRFMVVDRERYVSGPNVPDRTWVRLDPRVTTTENRALNDWVLLMGLPMNPALLVGTPRNAAVRRVGPAAIGSEQVTVYKVTTDGGSTTVSVDDHNRARRVVVDQRLQGKRTSLTIDLTRWGQHVPVEPPIRTVEFTPGLVTPA